MPAMLPAIFTSKGNVLDETGMAGLRLLGMRLREARLSLGLTQRRLERLSGVDQTTISRLENGRLPSLHLTRVGRIALVLGGHWTMEHPLHHGCRLLEGQPIDDGYRDDVLTHVLELADMPPTASGGGR
jgi:transcriptional regulator with XRE-family HTH domain